MGVPGLRLCSDIVADGLEQLHPAAKAPAPAPTPLPWMILRGRRGCAWVCVCGLDWIGRGGVCVAWCVCACECMCDMLPLLQYVRCSEVRGAMGTFDPVDEGASLEKTRNT